MLLVSTPQRRGQVTERVGGNPDALLEQLRVAVRNVLAARDRERDGEASTEELLDALAQLDEFA